MPKSIKCHVALGAFIFFLNLGRFFVIFLSLRRFFSSRRFATPRDASRFVARVRDVSRRPSRRVAKRRETSRFRRESGVRHEPPISTWPDTGHAERWPPFRGHLKISFFFMRSFEKKNRPLRGPLRHHRHIKRQIPRPNPTLAKKLHTQGSESDALKIVCPN